MWWPSTNFLYSFVRYYFPYQLPWVVSLWKRREEEGASGGKIQCRVLCCTITITIWYTIYCAYGGHWESLDEWVNMLSAVVVDWIFSFASSFQPFISKTDVKCAWMSAQTLMPSNHSTKKRTITYQTNNKKSEWENRPNVILLLLNSCFVYIIICWPS